MKEVTYLFKAHDGTVIIKSAQEKYAPNGTFLEVVPSKSINFDRHSYKTSDPEVIAYLDDESKSLGQWQRADLKIKKDVKPEVELEVDEDE